MTTESLSEPVPAAATILEQLIDDVTLSNESFLAGARRLGAATHADATTLLLVRELLQQQAPNAHGSRVHAAALARLDIAIADVGEAGTGSV